MAQRQALQTKLETILGSDQVYFQPPSNHILQYPCIIYSRTDIHTRHANNAPYKHIKEYRLTVIDENPDSLIPDEVSKLPRCVFERAFKADQLNHDIFTILF